MQNNDSISTPLYFTAVCWGDVFRKYLTTMLLPSLLSLNNLPVLKNKQASKFLLGTTSKDWRALQDDPIFKLTTSYITCEFIDLGLIDEPKQKMALMSAGHQIITHLIYRDKAIGVFLTPDLILSDGTVSVLQKLVACRKKVVLVPAIRYELHGCMQGFRKRGFIQAGKPITMTGRQMMSVALRNLHSETKTWIWDSPYYAANPVVSLWKAPGEANYIGHGYSWAPLAFDYSRIDHHDTTTFKHSTMDQDYVYRNFGINDDIYVVTDSDEIALVSFTTEEDLHISLEPQPFQSIPFLGKITKKDNLRRFHHCPLHAMDPLKRKNVLKTIYLHSDEITPKWKKLVRRAKHLVKISIKKPPDQNISYHAIGRSVVYTKKLIIQTYKSSDNRIINVVRYLLNITPKKSVNIRLKHIVKHWFNVQIFFISKINNITNDKPFLALLKNNYSKKKWGVKGMCFATLLLIILMINNSIPVINNADNTNHSLNTTKSSLIRLSIKEISSILIISLLLVLRHLIIITGILLKKLMIWTKLNA